VIKNTNQVKHLDDYLIAADDIEIGDGKRFPSGYLVFILIFVYA
jgi:hypothetical protein